MGKNQGKRGMHKTDPGSRSVTKNYSAQSLTALGDVTALADKYRTNVDQGIIAYTLQNKTLAIEFRDKTAHEAFEKELLSRRIM